MTLPRGKTCVEKTDTVTIGGRRYHVCMLSAAVACIFVHDPSVAAPLFLNGVVIPALAGEAWITTVDDAGVLGEAGDSVIGALQADADAAEPAARALMPRGASIDDLEALDDEPAEQRLDASEESDFDPDTDSESAMSIRSGTSESCMSNDSTVAPEEEVGATDLLDEQEQW